MCDAFRRIPACDVLYATDARWWRNRFIDGCARFPAVAELWTSTHSAPQPNGKPNPDDKSQPQGDHARSLLDDAPWLNTIEAERGSVFLPAGSDHILYGDNSGFAAIALAIVWGAATVYLIGFDMKNGEATHKLHHYRPGAEPAHNGNHGDHFFGDYGRELTRGNYSHFVPHFEKASRQLPAGVRIINATPDSALTCFEALNPYELESITVR